MDPINQALLAILTVLPNIAMYSLGIIATGLLAYGIVGSVLGYNLSRTFDDMSRGEAVKGAWADLKFEVARECRLTKESILAKAYASARLVKLLGAIVVQWAFILPGLLAMTMGYLVAPFGLFFQIMGEAFKHGYGLGHTSAENVLGDVSTYADRGLAC